MGIDRETDHSMVRAICRDFNARIAPVAELVDALDSKSSSQKECQFESGQGHHITLWGADIP